MDSRRGMKQRFVNARSVTRKAETVSDRVAMVYPVPRVSVMSLRDVLVPFEYRLAVIFQRGVTEWRLQCSNDGGKTWLDR